MQKYDFGEVIGWGAKGIVRRVTDRSSGAALACKMVRKKDFAVAEVVALRAMRGIPSVTQLIDVFEDDSHVHIVTELCTGGPLAVGPMPEAQAARDVVDLLSSLRSVHARGYVHRDVKPCNVMRSSDGLKLIDFGLATRLPVTACTCPRSCSPRVARARPMSGLSG